MMIMLHGVINGTHKEPNSRLIIAKPPSSRADQMSAAAVFLLGKHTLHGDGGRFWSLLCFLTLHPAFQPKWHMEFLPEMPL